VRHHRRDGRYDIGVWLPAITNYGLPITAIAYVDEYYNDKPREDTADRSP